MILSVVSYGRKNIILYGKKFETWLIFPGKIFSISLVFPNLKIRGKSPNIVILNKNVSFKKIR